MEYEEAKGVAKKNGKVYAARYDGEVWTAGRMVEVGDVISYHTSRAEAEDACRSYELIDFDPEHLSTSVEEMTAEDFD